MLCENCQENEATIHYIEINNGVKTEHHLCSVCADKLDLSDYVSVIDIDIPFVKLLTGLLSQNGSADEEADNPMLYVKCPQCGMNFAEFTRVGKFGCAECYDVFGPLIEDNMKKLHGSIQHKGKIYKKIKTKAQLSKEALGQNGKQDDIENGENEKLKQIAKLSHQLREAVKKEEFEEAAKLRDEIRALRERKDNNA